MIGDYDGIYTNVIWSGCKYLDLFKCTGFFEIEPYVLYTCQYIFHNKKLIIKFSFTIN